MKKEGGVNIVRYEIPYKTIPWFDGSKPLRINLPSLTGRIICRMG
jgi:hypothetical protein